MDASKIVEIKSSAKPVTSFQLKGGGWYKDGYANPRKKEPPKKTNTAKPDIAKKPPATKTSSSKK